MLVQCPPPATGSSSSEARMPTGPHDRLEALYARQNLLFGEVARLEAELNGQERDSDRAYILGLEIQALREEATRYSARIADVLERDLDR